MFKMKENMKVYRTLEEFVADTSRKYSPNVKLKNIQNLFFHFASFLLLISFVFFVHIFLSNYLQTINRRLIRLLAMIAQEYFFERSFFRWILNPRGNRIAVEIESTDQSTQEPIGAIV